MLSLPTLVSVPRPKQLPTSTLGSQVDLEPYFRRQMSQTGPNSRRCSKWPRKSLVVLTSYVQVLVCLSLRNIIL